MKKSLPKRKEKAKDLNAGALYLNQKKMSSPDKKKLKNQKTSQKNLSLLLAQNPLRKNHSQRRMKLQFAHLAGAEVNSMKKTIEKFVQKSQPRKNSQIKERKERKARKAKKMMPMKNMTSQLLHAPLSSSPKNSE